MNRLKSCAAASVDVVGAYSAWKAFGIKCTLPELVKQVPVTHDRVDFLAAHKCGKLLLPEETVARPTCMPEELVNLMDAQVAVFNGSALFPNAQFLPIARVCIDVLKVDQLKYCKTILEILMRNNYVVIEDNMNEWLCIPSQERWSIVTVKAGVKTSLIEDLALDEYGSGFVYLSATSLRATVDTTSEWKTGADYTCHDWAIRDFLVGLPVHPDIIADLQTANKWPIPQLDLDIQRYPSLMQVQNVPICVFKRQLRYLRDVPVLDNCDSLKIDELYRPAEHVWAFEKSIMCKQQSLASPHEFALAHSQKVSSLFKWLNGKKYHLVALRPSVSYECLCRALHDTLNMSFCSSMGLVCGEIPTNQNWIRCKIAAHDSEMLYWDVC
jgi:hypothetical protein